MPTATRATQNGAATEAAVAQTGAAAIAQRSAVAGDIVTRSTGALTWIVQSAAGKARELFEGCAAEFTMLAGLTVDAYHQPGLDLGDPTAWV